MQCTLPNYRSYSHYLKRRGFTCHLTLIIKAFLLSCYHKKHLRYFRFCSWSQASRVPGSMVALASATQYYPLWIALSFPTMFAYCRFGSFVQSGPLHLPDGATYARSAHTQSSQACLFTVAPCLGSVTQASQVAELRKHNRHTVPVY